MICLQGGGEFSPGCRQMDRAVLDGAPGPVVVTALAGRVGADYATATANGVRHLSALTGLEVLAAPDARVEPAPQLAEAGVLVLPGGSPSGLLAALRETPAGDALRAVLERGGRVVGSSAGAMVLCAWTVLPDAPGGRRVVEGLGVVPEALVLPHFRGRTDWLQGVPDGVRVLGLPEESGVLVDGDVLTGLGQAASTLLDASGRTTGTVPVGERSPW